MLAKEFDIYTSQKLFDRIVAGHAAMLACTKQAEHGMQWPVFKKHIAPGIAVYQVLRAYGWGQAEAVDFVDGLFRKVLFGGQRKGMKLVRLLPNPYPVVRLSLRMMSRNSYMPNSEVVVEDSKNCFEMQVKRCYYLDMMERYDVLELMPCYCATDVWLSALMPKVSFSRTKTLAQGDALCNFRWCGK